MGEAEEELGATVSDVEAVDDELPFSPELPRPNRPDINLSLKLCLSPLPVPPPPDSADLPDPIDEAEERTVVGAKEGLPISRSDSGVGSEGCKDEGSTESM